MQADVVRGPPQLEGVAAGDEFADEVGEVLVVGVPPGRRSEGRERCGRTRPRAPRRPRESRAVNRPNYGETQPRRKGIPDKADVVQLVLGG